MAQTAKAESQNEPFLFETDNLTFAYNGKLSSTALLLTHVTVRAFSANRYLLNVY